MAFLARATARCVALSATSAATSSTRQLSKHVRACRMPSSATTTSASSSSSARTASSALPTQLTRATFGLTHCRWFSASLDLNVQHTPASSQGDSSGSGSSSSSGASLMDPELADVVGAADTVGLAGSQETVASGADGGMMEVSDAAARRLVAIKARKSNDKLKLRVWVDDGGCSGYTYNYQLTEESPTPTDRVFERYGAEVLVDDISMPFLEGASLDLEDSLIKQGFAIASNPNAEKGCGCGSSFAPRMD